MSKFVIPERVLYVCTGSKSVNAYPKHHRDLGGVEVIRIECTDRCDFAPVCNIQPDNIWLKEYSEKDVLKLLQKLAAETSL